MNDHSTPAEPGPNEPGREPAGDRDAEPGRQAAGGEPGGDAGAEATTRSEPGGAGRPEPPRLYRSRHDRLIAGVAGGLGRYLGVDPLIVRIAFGLSLFFGGLGALVYLALVVFVPTEPADDGSDPPVQRSGWVAIAIAAIAAIAAFSTVGSLFFWDGDWGWGPGWGLGWVVILALVGYAVYSLLADRDEEPRGGRLLAALGVSAAAFVGLGLLAMISAYFGAIGSGIAVAGIVLAIGALLVGAAFAGGARWLIAPALALAIPLALVAGADISFGDGIGEREYRPLSVDAIPDDGYEIGIGRLAVDLRDLDWTPRSVVEVTVKTGIGAAIVAVPEDVCVVADARAKLGAVEVTGDEVGGIEVESPGIGASDATPRLELDGEVEIGTLRVINDEQADLDGDWGRFEHGDDAAARQRALEACAA